MDSERGGAGGRQVRPIGVQRWEEQEGDRYRTKKGV
jgi:hypothetical protein